MEFTAAEVAGRLKQRALEQGMDPALAFGLFVAENSRDGEWNPDRKIRLDTTSPKRAYGVMQVMPETHQGLVRGGFLSKDNKMATLDEQIDAGLAAMKEKIAFIGSSDPADVAVRYNAAIPVYHAWQKSGRNPVVLPAETQKYIQKVTRAMNENGMTPAQPMAVAPQPTGNPLAPLSGLLQQFGGAQQQFGSLLDAMLGQQQASAATQKAAQKQEADAKGQKISANTDAAVAQEAQRNAILSQSGGNLLDPSSRVAQANRTYGEAAAAEDQLTAQMQQLSQTSMFDNPAQWFMDQIKLNAVSKQWEVVAQRKAAAAQTLSQVQIAARAQMELNPAAVKDAMLRASQADIIATKAKADADAAVIDMDVRNQTINAAKVKLSLQGESLGRAIQLVGMQQEDLRWHEQQALRRGAESKDAPKVARINQMLVKFGKPAITSLEELKLLGKDAEELVPVLLNNEGSMGKDIGQVLFAANALGAFPYLDAKQPGLAGTLREVQAKAQEWLRLNGKPGGDAERETAKMSPNQKLEYAANKVWEGWRADAAKRTFDQLPKENPWKLKLEAAAQSKELENNIFAKYVLDRSKSGATELRERDLLQFAAASTEPSAKVAQQLQEFYQKGWQYQAELMGVGLAGLDLSDPHKDNLRQKAVKYRVAPESMLGGLSALDSFSLGVGMKDLDMFNLADVQNLVVKAQQSEKMQERMRNFLANPLGLPASGGSIPEQQRAARLQEEARQRMLETQQGISPNKRY
jgi:hypothetical protein